MILSFVLGWLLWPGHGTKNQEQEVVASVRTVVTQFGKELKKVSLLAPDATGQIEAHYASFVSDDLLARWRNDPEAAPGRLASSPWPACIEVVDIKKKGAGEFDVRGAIVFMTSTQNPTKEPVKITVEKLHDEWKITSWQKKRP